MGDAVASAAYARQRCCARDGRAAANGRTVLDRTPRHQSELHECESQASRGPMFRVPASSGGGSVAPRSRATSSGGGAASSSRAMSTSAPSPYAPHPLRWLSGACRRAPRPRPRPPASAPSPEEKWRQMSPNVTLWKDYLAPTAPRPMPSRSGSSAPLRSIPASFRSFPAFERIGTMAGDARGRRRNGCVECGARLPKEHSWPSQTARA